MPNYYAHLKFGGKVLEALPQGLADAIAAEREAFDLGCLGPDPLFFYQPLRPNAVRREGVRMHRRSALPAAEGCGSSFKAMPLAERMGSI